MFKRSVHRDHKSVRNHHRLIGQKPPLEFKDIWADRERPQFSGRLRDLALFNLAIDSK